MSLQDTYDDTFEQATPEPMPVVLTEQRCPKHNFRFISMPREANDTDDLGFVAKCVLRTCYEGILKPRVDE
jgi:hypothetical protein